jgi:hypothetical protein
MSMKTRKSFRIAAALLGALAVASCRDLNVPNTNQPTATTLARPSLAASTLKPAGTTSPTVTLVAGASPGLVTLIVYSALRSR